MKQPTALLLCIALACALLTGCGQKAPTQTENNSPSVVDPADLNQPAADGSESSEPDSSVPDSPQVEAPKVDADGAYLMLDASDAYDGAYSFVTKEAGTYSFKGTNAAGYEDVSWSVFVFDEAVDQLEEGNVPALNGDGSIALEAGKYVYCQCSLNALTGEEVPGASVLLVDFVPAQPEPGADEKPGETGAEEKPEPLVIDGAEAYESSTYSFQAAYSGTYEAVSITEEWFDLASVGCEEEGIEWTFYVLDEQFEEPARFLSQAYESVLVGDGSFEVKEGQYVYCVSNVNSFTADEMPQGVNTLVLTIK